MRTVLVNEHPVTCCLYFNKLIDTIIFLLKSTRLSPFYQYRIVDFFKRVEFQQRDRPHVHCLICLENDPKEIVSENIARDHTHYIRVVQCRSSKDRAVTDTVTQAHVHVL